jgi:hypothetical protein
MHEALFSAHLFYLLFQWSTAVLQYIVMYFITTAAHFSVVI